MTIMFKETCANRLVRDQPRKADQRLFVCSLQQVNDHSTQKGESILHVHAAEVFPFICPSATLPLCSISPDKRLSLIFIQMFI